MVSRETPALPGWLEPARKGIETYHDLLAGPGIDRGLIGPREAERLWDRHILNCAVVADPDLGLIPQGSTVADVGSGAGLPGLVWAIARPDIQCILVEPLLRRATFLMEAIGDLGVGNRVRVERGRAEDLLRTGWVPVGVATARAVAPLAKLAAWTLPLVAPDGVLLALKGASVQEEIDASGLARAQVVLCGTGVVDPPTTVVVVPAAQSPQ